MNNVDILCILLAVSLFAIGAMYIRLRKVQTECEHIKKEYEDLKSKTSAD